MQTMLKVTIIRWIDGGSQFLVPLGSYSQIHVTSAHAHRNCFKSIVAAPGSSKQSSIFNSWSNRIWFTVTFLHIDNSRSRFADRALAVTPFLLGTRRHYGALFCHGDKARQTDDPHVWYIASHRIWPVGVDWISVQHQA